MAPEVYRAPRVEQARITPEFIRDELLRCFESANRQFYHLLNQPVADDVLRRQVSEFVTGVFQQCGASFESPTKQGIVTAIGQCKRNAETMMGDGGADIIRHHYDEMMQLVSRLPEA